MCREQRREGGRGEEHQCERETPISCLSYAPHLGTEPATQACALTGNQTSDLLLCQTMANQPSHTGQDYIEYFLRLEWDI